MSILSVDQTRSYAAKAGFTGSGLDIIVAIAQAESGLNTAATGQNTDGSIDRGIVQINNKYHSEVTDSCAFDPGCAFSAAYRISNLGTDFSPWSTYTSGAYKKYLSANSGGVVLPSGKQWYQYPITHGYITSYLGAGTDTPHYAFDIGAPMDTPFYFPDSGTVQIADYAVWSGQPGGGEVFIEPDKGGPEEYAYHLDQIIIRPGSHVVAGQVIGYTGGQNYGGQHPTSPMWSSGPHVHFGLFTNYTNTPAGSRPYGPSPESIISNLQQFGIGNGGGQSNGSDTSNFGNAFTSLSDQVHAILVEFPGFVGIAVALDDAEKFPGIVWYGSDTTSSINPIDQVNAAFSTVGNAIRSVLDTIISNTLPAAVRGLFIGVGIIILAGLAFNAVENVAQDVAPIVESIAPLAGA